MKMANSHANLKNPDTGETVTAPIGFSWTTLFFGMWPALFRGDFKWGLIMFGLAVVTSGISLLVFPFLYNKLYVKNLLRNGYKVESVENGSVEVVSNKVSISKEKISLSE